MKRNKGYIDLTKILDLPLVVSKWQIKDFIEYLRRSNYFKLIKSRNKNFVFSFDGMEDTYFFKYDSYVSPYNELVAEELAKDLMLPCASYDLAQIGPIKGVVSKNFKEKDAKHLTGSEILTGYKFRIFKDNNDLKYGINSLDNIWLALEERYKDRINCDEIVRIVMGEIVRMFLFDVLVGDCDRHDKNWGIVEYDDGRVELEPIYDNARALFYPKDLDLMVEASTDIDFNRNLIKFLKVSSQEFKDILVNFMWVIEPDNLENVFKRIEVKTAFPMPDSIKHDLLSKFKRHKEKIEKILDLVENKDVSKMQR